MTDLRCLGLAELIRMRVWDWCETREGTKNNVAGFLVISTVLAMSYYTSSCLDSCLVWPVRDMIGLVSADY